MWTAACHWDVEPLRRRDVVEVVDVELLPDVIVADDVIDASRPDAVDVVIPPDVPTTTCTVRATPDWRAAGGFQFGRSMIIRASTLGAPSLLSPPSVSGSGCPLDTSMNPASEQVYRYVVETGPRLYLTTDAPTCASVYDTILYARTTCDQGSGTVLGCDDDSHTLSSCGTPASFASSLLLEGLLPRQVVFVVVDGYMGRAGDFQLVMTENAAANAAVGTDTALTYADRCMCRDTTDTLSTAVPFPSGAGTDRYTTSTGTLVTRLANPGDKLSGPHRMPYGRIAGVALETRLAVNGLTTDARCIDTTATFDLMIDNKVVHAFSIDVRTPVTVPLRVAYQTFGPITVTTAADVQVAIRLRTITPLGCGSIEFDRAFAMNNLTVLGH